MSINSEYETFVETKINQKLSSDHGRYEHCRKIFGPDIGALKGKTIRSKPIHVKKDLIEIPKELIEQHNNLTICMDVMFVNGLPMFTCIDRTIKFRGLVPLEDRTSESFYTAIDKVLCHINNAGFLVSQIHCDGEFKSLMDEIKDELNVDMNYTSRNEHVPEAERNNRTIAERIRAIYNLLPYKTIPKIMIKYLAMVVTKQLNMFPDKGGVSAYLSPHVFMGGQDLDYNKHCQIPFGAYVQGAQENNPTNTNAPRTIDAIYLRPLNNIQGGHELMNLSTGKVITRRKVVELPVTDLIIKTVEGMAEKQGMKTLKINLEIILLFILLIGKKEVSMKMLMMILMKKIIMN